MKQTRPFSSSSCDAKHFSDEVTTWRRTRFLSFVCLYLSPAPDVDYDESGLRYSKDGARCYYNYGAGNPSNSDPYDFIHSDSLGIESFVSVAPLHWVVNLTRPQPISSEIPIDPVLQHQSAHAT